MWAITYTLLRMGTRTYQFKTKVVTRLMQQETENKCSSGFQSDSLPASSSASSDSFASATSATAGGTSFLICKTEWWKKSSKLLAGSSKWDACAWPCRSYSQKNNGLWSRKKPSSGSSASTPKPTKRSFWTRQTSSRRKQMNCLPTRSHRIRIHLPTSGC